MYVLGLTGSIGMGKTEAGRAFRRLGVPVYDADAEVHKLFRRGGAAVEAVGRVFPGVVKDGAVDRAELGTRVFGDERALRKLESIVHPLLQAGRHDFLERAARAQHRVVVLDVPLMFETGADSGCDGVAVVSAPSFVQRRRVLKRPGMSEARLVSILARQMPDREKQRRADFVIPTGLDRGFSLQRIVKIVRIAEASRGHVWPNGRKPPRHLARLDLGDKER
jgi:dephospho-CoA kinase